MSHSYNGTTDRQGHTGEEEYALPLAAYTAAALMGAGDGIMNTVAVARLGRLAEDDMMLPRTTAFQFFQCVNVFMTGVSFVCMRYWPLSESLVQVWILLALACSSALAFTLFTVPAGLNMYAGPGPHRPGTPVQPRLLPYSITAGGQ